MIIIESKRNKIENILKKYPDAVIVDVTSNGGDERVKLSPFYPHGGIPVPFSDGVTAECVEGVWQGLKVFEGEDVDMATFRNRSMKNIKRSVRKHGKVLGHRKGVKGKEILDYVEAKHLIYIPTYKWMLQNKVADIIDQLREKAENQTVVLLDYNTCCDVDSPVKPLSHAYLVKAYIEGLYPYRNGDDRNSDEYTLPTLPFDDL
ncbi:MAG: hypothetical protein K2J27_06280 [Duncaniella sp.]|nr:hypothetical protein [Duncaniella sp.]